MNHLTIELNVHAVRLNRREFDEEKEMREAQKFIDIQRASIEQLNRREEFEDFLFFDVEWEELEKCLCCFVLGTSKRNLMLVVFQHKNTLFSSFFRGEENNKI
jgi:hypothetical protein